MLSNMTSVKVLAISHETANLAVRSIFHFNEQEQLDFTNGVKEKFNLQGLIILATCNRTEIYFETEKTSADELLDFLLKFKGYKGYYADYFLKIDDSAAAMRHLLEVMSGLRSLVVGDMQIISQFKAAYALAQERGLQGKLLERAVQTVFKMHKRVQNETDFRSGSASTSYLALLTARQRFGKLALANKNVLLIGAGEIIQEVAKYMEKFTFGSVTIINRTQAKAAAIAQKYAFQTADFLDLEQQVAAADIIISGVGNQSNIVQMTGNLANFTTQKLFIDLGMPANIHENITENAGFELVNIDDLNTKTEQVEAKRQQAIDTVQAIIDTEQRTFQIWLDKLPINQSLGRLKNHIQEILTQEMNTHFAHLSPAEHEFLIQRLSQQLIKQPAKTLHQHTENKHLADALVTAFAL